VRLVTQNLNGDILGGIAMLALLQGKFAHGTLLTTDDDACGSREARPVSVQSLARSLRTPAETMRRCVARLLERGWLERVPAKGIVISNNPKARAEIAALLGGFRSEFRRMLVDLKSIGFDFDLMDQASEQSEAVIVDVAGLTQISRCQSDIFANHDPAVDRAILDFALRIVDEGTTPLFHNYVLSCVMGAIVSANTSSVAYDPEVSWVYGSEETSPPDDARRPVTLAEISQLLGIPYETTRRYVNTLVRYRLCVRDERKMLTVPTILMNSPISQSVRTNIVKRFVQMVSEMKRLGVDFRAIDARAKP